MAVGLLGARGLSSARRRAHHRGEDDELASSTVLLRLQSLAGNRACQSLVKGPAQRALLSPATSRTVGDAVRVQRQAEEEEGAGGGEGGAASVCGFEVQEAEPLARAAEKELVTVQDVGSVGSGDATVVCDGKGGFRVALGMYQNFPCGVKNCVTKHENVHIADIKRDVPNACKDKDDGATPEVRVDNPQAWKNMTECKAHTAELACLKKTRGEPGCKPVLDRVKAKTEQAKSDYCG